MFLTSSSHECAGLRVHFDHAGIGRHLDHVQARIVRRRVALDQNRKPQLRGRIFDRRDEFKIILEIVLRRHEDSQHAAAHFRAQAPCG